MASYRLKYTVNDFKADSKLSETNNSKESDNSDASDEDSEISSEDLELEYNQEDMLISKLYRNVVDSIMSVNKLREMDVDSAISEMKQEIFQGHKKGFRSFREVHFSDPSKCCAYLRRYAICHTALVKQIMWNFFISKDISVTAKEVRDEITEKNHLKIISLGGGPGNDFVGFCSALEEIPNSVRKLDLYIVDINKSWESVFPAILGEACRSDFGSFSQCVKKTKLRNGFMQADLTADRIFENKDLSATLRRVNIVLMVKLTSFLPNKETENLIHNVVNSMEPESKLIFIDQPYDQDFFRRIKSLYFIYGSFTKYELPYKPSRYRSPSITSAQAHIGIYKKINCLSEDSSSNEES